MFRSTEKARNAGRKGRIEDDEGRDGVGSLMGVGSLLKFWGLERTPLSKIETNKKLWFVNRNVTPNRPHTKRKGGRRRKAGDRTGSPKGREGGREG